MEHFRDLCRKVARNVWRYQRWRLHLKSTYLRVQEEARRVELLQAERAATAAREVEAEAGTAANRRAVVLANANHDRKRRAYKQSSVLSEHCQRRLKHVEALEEPAEGAAVVGLPLAPRDPPACPPVRAREADGGAEVGVQRGLKRSRRLR